MFYIQFDTSTLTGSSSQTNQGIYTSSSSSMLEDLWLELLAVLYLIQGLSILPFSALTLGPSRSAIPVILDLCASLSQHFGCCSTFLMIALLGTMTVPPFKRASTGLPPRKPTVATKYHPPTEGDVHGRFPTSDETSSLHCNRPSV